MLWKLSNKYFCNGHARRERERESGKEMSREREEFRGGQWLTTAFTQALNWAQGKVQKVCSPTLFSASSPGAQCNVSHFGEESKVCLPSVRCPLCPFSPVLSSELCVLSMPMQKCSKCPSDIKIYIRVQRKGEKCKVRRSPTCRYSAMYCSWLWRVMFAGIKMKDRLIK